MILLIISRFLLASSMPEVLIRSNSSSVTQAEELRVTVEITSSGANAYTVGTPRGKDVSFSVAHREKIDIEGKITETIHYTVEARPGSYILQPPIIYLSGVEREPLGALYVDIGVEGPTSTLAPVREPPNPAKTSLWVTLVAVAVGFGWWLKKQVFIRRKSIGRVQERWGAIFTAELSDRERAISLSYSFREYLEQQEYGTFLSLSPSECSEALQHTMFLSTAQCQQISVILSRLDSIKYTGETVANTEWDALRRQMLLFVTSVELT